MRDFSSEPSDEDMLNFTLRQRYPPIFRISDMARKKRENTEKVTGSKPEYSRWMVEDNKRRKASLAQWMAGTGGGDFDRIYGGAGGVGRGKGSFDANQAAYLDAYGQMAYDFLPEVHSEELRPMVRHGWKPPKSMEHMTDYLVDGPFDDGWNKKHQNFPKSKVAIRDLPQGIKNMMNNLRDVNFGFPHQFMLDDAEDEYGRVGTRNAQQEYRKPGGARDQFMRRTSMEAADLLNFLDNSRNRDNQEVLDNFKESDLEWNSADRPRGEHVSQSPSRRVLKWPWSLRTLHETDEDEPVIMNEAFPENFQLFNRSEDEIFETAWSLLKAPLYEYPEDIDNDDDGRFTMMPDMRKVGLNYPDDEYEGEPYYWQSFDEKAKGTMHPEDGDAVIDMFEIAQEIRGKGLAQDYLREMIEEAHDEYGDKPIKVPTINPGVEGFWSKMKERGVVQ